MGILDKDNPLIPQDLALQLNQLQKTSRPKRTKRTEPWVSTNGYMYTYNEDGKPVLLHRFLMEKKMGRKLTRNEEVRFRDGNKLNCLPENLYLANEVSDPDSVICLHCGKPALKA